ncbi:Eco57I restriction-modification methylase domain-containing protein [Nocardia sp. GCM10030253]|uniref:Eco57I restriction-modification methylase domain-containing protein n=1 Tax=Nocardia sp. GCM10030253 TaxID=3273404 RepID=UPI0036337E6D
MASEIAAARDRKRHGRHYTPPALARFLAQRLLEHMPRPGVSGVLRVLDPACGDGELLLALRREAAVRLPGVLLELVGYDLDDGALMVARERACAAGTAVDWRVGDFLTVSEGIADGCFDAIITNPPYVRTQQLGATAAQLLSKRFGLRGRIDLTHPFVAIAPRLLCQGGVLGLLCANRFLTTKAGANIRGLLLSELAPVELYDLGDTKLFEAAVLPAITIATRTPRREPCRYVSAYEVAGYEIVSGTGLFEALTETEGRFITHNGRSFAVEVGTLATGELGSHVREVATSQSFETGVVGTDGVRAPRAAGAEAQAATGVGAGVADGVVGDAADGDLDVGGVTSEESAGGEVVESSGGDGQFDGGDRRGSAAGRAWRMSRPGVDDWLGQVGAGTWKTFGEVARIRVGIKTTADRVFISDRWGEMKPGPEPELLFDLITHHDLEPWRITGGRGTRVLYPYDITRTRRVPVDLGEFPGAAAYLRTHEEALAGRKYVTASGRAWFEIWVPQRPHLWGVPKLVFPDISERPRFALDRSGAVVNGDCYWMSLADIGICGDAEQLAYLLMGVANSALGLRFYDAVCGNRLYSGRRRWITQYVSRLPLPDPARSAGIVELVAEFVDGGRSPDPESVCLLNERVAAAFGLRSGRGADTDHRQQNSAGEVASGLHVVERDEPVWGQCQRESEPGHDLGDQVGVEIVGAVVGP